MINNFKEWLPKALIRAAKTFAQTFLSLIPMGAAILGDINWTLALSSAGLAAFISILTSIVGLPEVKNENKDVSCEEIDKNENVEDQ